METWEVGVFHQIIQTQTHVIGQTRCIRTIDDASFKRRKDLCEIHHDRLGTELFKDLCFHARRRAEFEIFQSRRAIQRLGGCQALLAINPPANELHIIFVVERLRIFQTAAVV